MRRADVCSRYIHTYVEKQMLIMTLCEMIIMKTDKCTRSSQLIFGLKMQKLFKYCYFCVKL